METTALTQLSDSDLDFIVRETGSVKKAIAYCTRISQVDGPLSGQYSDAAERLRVSPRWARAKVEGPKVAVIGCHFCPEPASWLMPSSEDQGKTIEWTPCCMGCATGWWNSTDWDGSALEAVIVQKQK